MKTSERLRRSMLFVPGNKPGMIQSAGVYGADNIILDLEDAVSPAEKDSARILVRNAMKSLDFNGAEVVVRINPLLPADLIQSADSIVWPDLEEIVMPGLDAVMLPKAGAEEVKILSAYLDRLEAEKGLGAGSIQIIPLVETAQGIIHFQNIVQASRRITAVLLGAEDLTADLSIKRTVQGDEILFARSWTVMVCKAAGIEAIDTPFTDTRDKDGLLMDTRKAKSLGFAGKAAIHPGQVETIHEALTPDTGEIAYAQRVLEAMEKAEQEGLGVIALDNKMIDTPVVARARLIMKKAQAAGLLQEVLK